MSKIIYFRVTAVNHSKVHVLDVAIGSDAPAGEILDQLEDVFDEKVNATQIIRVERLPDPLQHTSTK